MLRRFFIKNIKSFLILALGCAGLTGAEKSWSFPNLPYRVAVPASRQLTRCEMVVDGQFLAQLSGNAQLATAAQLAVAAPTSLGVKPVPVAVTGQNSRAQNIRFELPTEARSFWLYFGAPSSPKSITAPAAVNLLPGALRSQQWRPRQGQWRVSSTPAGLKLQLCGRNSGRIFKDFELPAAVKPGSPVVLDYTLSTPDQLPWNLAIQIRQLDQLQRELSNNVIDPRWSTMNLPPRRTVSQLLAGRLDPRAKKIRVEFNCHFPNEKFDRTGRRVAQPQTPIELRIAKLELRSAELLDLPPLNAQWFECGKSGRSALRLTGQNAPFFAVNPPEVWAGNCRNLLAQENYHWSCGAGTFELWLCPDWAKSADKVTIFDVFQYQRKSLMQLTYQAQTSQLNLHIKDFSDHQTTLKTQVKLPQQKWSHLAVCWSKNSGVKLFVNGRVVEQAPEFHFSPLKLRAGQRADRRMPELVTIGAPTTAFFRGNLNKPAPQFLRGAIAQVRSSRQVRYRQNFTPPEKLSFDAATCAWFTYDADFNGIHSGGDQFVSGGMLSSASPWCEKMVVEKLVGGKIFAHQVATAPAKIPRIYDPQQVLPINNYPHQPTAADFAAGRVVHRRQLELKGPGSVTIPCGDTVFMNSLEIACPADSKPLIGPIMLNSGEVDCRSYANLASTLFPEKTKWGDDYQRAVRLFKFMIHSSDYFMSRQLRVTPNNTPGNAEYDGLRQLVSYCGFECGPLNAMTMNMAVNVLGIPACGTSGNYHAFQQFFIGSNWQLFDLSAQTFFTARSKSNAASLAAIEFDPSLLGRRNLLHYITLGAKGVQRFGLSPQRRRIFTLSPGEAFRVHWQNNGIYNDLHRVTPRWRPQAGAVGRDVTAQIGFSQVPAGETVRQIDRPFPHFASGFLRFNGAVKPGVPAFPQVGAGTFVYQIDLPYPVVAATYHAEGKNVSYALSYDQGRTWRAVSADKAGYCHLQLEVRGRHRYQVRVRGNFSGNFHAETQVQLNPRLLTGALRPGVNHLNFCSDAPDAAARVTWVWRSNAPQPLKLADVCSWGVMPGEEKQMVILTNRRRELTVAKLSPHAQLKAAAGLHAQLRGNKISLASASTTPELKWVEIQDGQVRKTLTVAIIPGARWIPASKMRPGKNVQYCQANAQSPQACWRALSAAAELVIPFDRIPAGKYLIFHLGRNPLMPQNGILADVSGQALPSVRLVRKTNNSAEFYKAEKLLWRFRWDYPIQGRYPYEQMKPLTLAALKQLRLTYRHPGVETAGVLLIPADNAKFLSLFRQYLCGFNFQLSGFPQLFQ